jgi:uncharacterized UPF0160 family protein
VTFVVVSALVMLSLFVGAVTMAMSESRADMKVEQEEAETKERLLKKQKRMAEMAEKGETQTAESFNNKDTATMSIRERDAYKAEFEMRNLLLEAWSGIAGKELESA